MQIHIFTLFPDFFDSIFKTSILKRAQEAELVEFKIINIRDFTTDKHHITDDRPYGGGPGMVMKVEPIDLALEKYKFKKGTTGEKIVLTSAKGDEYVQELAVNLSKLKRLAIICGHYEGVDERVAKNLIDQEIRIGNYVLTGGELPAGVIADSVIRLLPGVLGNDESINDESHQVPGKMDFPQYTRPETYRDWSVPEDLLTGHHEKIKDWREKNRG